MESNKLCVYGDQKVQVPAHLNFGKFILDRLRVMEDTTAIVIENDETGEKITYEELKNYAVKLSIALTKLGVRKGNVVALGSENHSLIIPTALAVLFSGAIFTSYDIASGRAHLQHLLSITQPDYFICTELFWRTNQEVVKSFKSIKMFITLDKGPESLTSVHSLISSCDVNVDLFEPVRVQGQIDTAHIFYSSGTTGMPKGVLLTHMNCILQSLSYDDFKNDFLKVVYILGEWHHSYNFFVTYEMLGLGKKIVYTNNITPSLDLICKTVEKQQVDIAFVVPSVVSRLSKTNENECLKLESLKFVYSTSSPIHVKTIEQLKKRVPSIKSVLQSYGMTEAGALTSENWGLNISRAGSVGKAYPGITIKVIHPETKDNQGPNQQGEICIRGPALMKGYINVDPDAYLDEDSFFRTGDLGYYDEDGYFYIIGRLKEMIKFDGIQVDSLELEAILMMHPEVREAGVVGKPVPVYGEEPTAFVVRQPGSSVTEQELVDFVAIGVAPYMQLKGGVRFIPELPRNPRGKILRRRLREMLNNC